MNYKDVRDKFVVLSGRYDLTTATAEDNGADFFLNEGQKLLDRKFSGGKGLARYPVVVVEGAMSATTTGLRVVKEVWVSNTDGRTELVRESFNTIRNAYQRSADQLVAGTPSYYAPGIFRPYPDTLATAGIAGMYDVSDLLLDGTHYTYDGILFSPPANGTYTMQIVGLFDSPTLSATLSGVTWTQTKSFWTEVHPATLIKAGLFALESFYRSSQGMKDRMDSLMVDLTELDHDLVEQTVAGESLQMGG